MFAHRAIPIVLAAVLIDSIGFGIIMPVLPQLITTIGQVGLEEATRIAGYMLVVFAATQFVASPILGNLADRFGRRPVLIAAMLAFAADYALMAVAPTLAWLFLGRAVAGIAGATYGPATAVIADVTPPDKRGATFAYIGAAFGLGFIIGPAIGGLVAGWGTRAPFIVAALLAAVNAAAMLALLPETHARENRRPFRLRDAHIVGAFRPLFHAGNAAPLLIAWFLWQVAHMVYPATWSFWAAIRFDWDARAIGWSLAFVGLVMVLVQAGLTGRLIARVGERWTVIIGLVSGAGAFYAYTLITQGWMAYVLFVVGSLQMLVFPAMNGLLSRLVDATRQGALQGGIASMNSLAAVIGPLALTQALALGAERGHPGAAFLLAAILATAALLILVWRVLGRVPPKAAVPVA